MNVRLCRSIAHALSLSAMMFASFAHADPPDASSTHHVRARIESPQSHDAPADDAPSTPAFVFEYNFNTQTAPDAPPPRASVRVDEDGLNVYSADEKFHLGVSPFVQFAYRLNRSDLDGGSANGFVLQKFRPSIRGSYHKILAYKFTLDITTSSVHIHDAFMELRAHPRLTFRLGLQKPVFGSEQRQSTRNTLFLSRSLASSIGASRDLGLALDAQPHDRLRVELGVYNGTGNRRVFRGFTPGSAAMNAGVRWAVIGHDRATAEQPSYLTVGAATHLRRVDASEGIPQLTSTASVGGRTTHAYANDAYAHGRVFNTTAFAYGGYGGLFILAEFVTSNQAIQVEDLRTRVVEHAWHAAVSYAFGGTNGWNGVLPHQSVFDGGLGALRLSARLHGKHSRSRGGEFLVDTAGVPTDALHPISAGGSIAWQLSKHMRVQSDYDFTRFDGNFSSSLTPTEHVVRFGITAGY